MALHDQVQEMRGKGASQREIAEALGISRYRVSQALKESTTAQERASAGTKTVSTGALARVEGTTLGQAMGRSKRLSRDTERSRNRAVGTFAALMADGETDGDYKFEWMDSDTLRSLPLSKIIEVAISSSPEVSRAVWDFHRAMVPGWEITVTDPKGDEHEGGAKLIKKFRRQISDYHGGEAVLYTEMATAIFLRGNLLSEVYFADDTKTPVDIVVPDPATVRFKQANDPVRGDYWQVGQYHGAEWVPLDVPTVRYVALDPLPGRPYGRSPISAAVFPAVFLLGMFQDLRRVIANQGWPRMDVEVDISSIQELVELAGDPSIDEGKVVSILNAAVAQVEEALETMEPMDTYVHTSMVKVNRPVGAVGSGDLGDVDKIIARLEGIAVKALKTMPLLQGITDSVSEANANRQWEMWAAGIKTLQHLLENSLEAHFNLVLQANGIDATCKFRFAELRAAEELRDAQTLQVKVNNAIALEQAGYMLPDEAAIMATGHGIPPELVEARKPLLNTGAYAGNVDDIGTGQDGNERFRNPLYPLATTRAAEGMLPPVPQKVTVTMADALEASDMFDEMYGEYAGLLEAEVVEGTNGEAE